MIVDFLIMEASNIRNIKMEISLSFSLRELICYDSVGYSLTEIRWNFSKIE